MATINWNIFETTYLRAELADIYGDKFDKDTLLKLTYATIANLKNKGLLDLSPEPSTTLVPAISKIQNIILNNLSSGNKIFVTINGKSLEYSVTSNLIPTEVTGLVTMINSSTEPELDTITATNKSSYIQIEGDLGEDFSLVVVSNLGTGSSNPTTEIQTIQLAEEEELILDEIDILTADFTDAWAIVAAGVKWMLVSDPVTSAKTTTGLDITKNKDLVILSKTNFDLLTLSYLIIHNITNIYAEFWKPKLEQEIIINGSTGGSSLADQLALLLKKHEYTLIEEEAKTANKVEIDDNYILDTNTQTRLNQDNTTRNQKSILQLQRQWKLENDFKQLTNKQATNGYWTPAGQITVSFLSDYKVELEDTIIRDLNNIPNSYFGLGYQVNNGVQLTGVPVDITKYNKLQITVTSDNPVTYSFYASDNGVVFNQIGVASTNTQITKEYYLPPSKFIRVDILGTVNNTNFYIEGTLVA